jgi:hypothetical protein
MTLHRSPLAFECDACGATIDEDDAGVEGFEELKEAIDRDGWVTRQVDGVWVHFCPDDKPED